MVRTTVYVLTLTLLIGPGLPVANAAQTPPTGTVRGTVTDPLDAAVVGVNLTIAPVGGGAGRTASTNERGAFTFSGLPAGTYVLRAEHAGFLPFARGVTVVAGVDAEETVRLAIGASELVSVVSEDAGYRTTLGATATKMSGVPIRDIPFAVEAVPARVLEEQRVQTVNDALRNVSGIGPSVGFGGANSRYVIRGFSPAAQLRNGFRHNIFVPMTDMANVEQVEVLKGPASALYGSFDPGGVVSILTKRPQPVRYAQATVTAGSFGYVRPTLDVTGPIGGSQQALYRFNAAFETTNGHRDFVDHDRIFLAPAVEWRPSTRTSLLVEGDFLRQTGGFDRGFGNSPIVLTLPRERNLGEPIDSLRYNGGSVRYVLEHRFSERWALRHGLSATSGTLRTEYFGGASPLVQGTTYNRRSFAATDRQRDVVTHGELYGSLGDGRIRHQMMAGVEFADDVYDFDVARGALAPLDLNTPVYGAVPTDTGPYWIGTFKNRSIAGYAQDMMTIGQRWRVLVGARYTGQFSDADLRFDLLAGPYASDRMSHNVSPRAGVTFQPTSQVSLYTSVGRSFRSVVDSIAVGGSLPEPSIGRLVEGGVKADLRGGQLVPTISVFRLTRDKVLVANPDDPFGPFIQTGEQEAKGVEVTLNARPVRRWEAVATYAYTRAAVTKDSTLPIGTRLINVPRQTFSLWSTYTLPDHIANGLAVSAGVFYIGDRAANTANSFDLEAYTVLDAAVSYRLRRWAVGLNLRNLLDERYFESGGGFVVAYPGAPRSVTTTLSVMF